MMTSFAKDARVLEVKVKKKIPGLLNQRAMNSGAPSGWKNCSTSLINVSEMEPESYSVELYATISTWMDADIIEANVKNCFANGCSRVYLLDNDSSDGTVEAAMSAGATIGEIFETEFYDEDLRIRKQNEIVRRVTTEEKHKILWWINLDADEFCVGLNGERVIDTILRMPSQISTIGSDCIDLYPTEGREYVIGEHPAKCFDKGINRVEGSGHFCPAAHYKHLYFKQTDGVFNVAQTRGNHCLATPKKSTLYEPNFTLRFFHAPYRRKQETQSRLEALCAKKNELGGLHRSVGDDECTGNHGSIKRWKTLEHVYSGEWDKVEMPHTQMYGRPIVGLALYPWRVLAPELSWMFQ
jgi:hypothetical protein